MNFLQLVQEELEQGRKLHGNLHSFHEGLGVLMEEWNEVQEEVFKKTPDRVNLLKELVQVAAVCM